MANSFQTEREAPDYESIAELAGNIVFRLPGCDDEMVRRALRDAYGDFCRLSHALATVRPIPLSKEVATYPVPALVPDCIIESVCAVEMDCRRLMENQDYLILPGTTPVIQLRDYLVPAEDEDDGDETFLRVTCVEIPKPESERAPKWFIRKYAHAIEAGALARLFGMTGRAWADAMQQRTELVRYENAITRARMAVESGSPFGSGSFDPVDTSGLL